MCCGMGLGLGPPPVQHQHQSASNHVGIRLILARLVC
uniref:Uncharacterized protein n=1 Tax=Arundo donax TaxID=35708 RepID=A0A0A9CXD1_ARUDO